MRGDVNDIVRIFDGNDTELVIPVYQRNYDWSEEQCSRLFDDLVEVIKQGRLKHFFGAVVGNPETKFRWVIIDGQQRITTVSLLILALVDSLDAEEIESEDPELADRLRRNYLENSGSTVAEPKLKLKPVKDDMDSYRRLLTGQEFNERSNATANYRYFRERIVAGELNGDELWEAIGRLQAMILDLEPHDEPQRIFESLNSTGKSLTEADKIRNLVLMGQPVDVQDRLYEDFWNRIEHNVSFETNTFIRLYLVSRTRRMPRFDALYDAFKKFLVNEGREVEETLRLMRDYSEYFRDLNSAQTGVPYADKRLRRLNLAPHEVAMPALMPLLADYREGAISADDFAKTVELIDSYIFRRLVVGLQTNALNKIFATLYSEARRIRHGGASIADVIAFLLYRRADTSGEFPDDERFAEAFKTKNFFNFRAQNRRYLFECLENGFSKDTVDIANALERGDLSVEHIMPQTLTKEWRASLGPEAEEIHQTWLHRIGNLTVTGYNSEYSNYSFQLKKTVEEGFNASPYRLNRLVKTENEWGVEQMRRRTDDLVEQALTYWPMPSSEFEPKREPLPQIPMGEDTDFSNRRIVAYDFDEMSVAVSSYRELMRSLIKHFVTQRRDDIFAYAAGPSVGFTAGAKPANRYQEEIVPELWVTTRNSTHDKMTILRSLFAHLDLDPDELVFTLRPEPAREEEAEEEGCFSDVIKYLPQFEALEGTDATEEDIAPLRAGLEGAMASHFPEPLPMRDTGNLLTEATESELEPEEIAAAFQSLVAVDKLLSGQYRNAVVNGTVSALLRQLKRFN
ncbi:DUF262 domain-containing protein [Corynebacterium sp. LK2590]|uniref:DUF262 domain-containing protein n=1 Tax=unclassified Corynebacterium TaxID=2624378 RepID=UPI0034CEC513